MTTEAEQARSLASVAPAPLDFAGERIGTDVQLTWTDLNPGDYNSDGAVSGLDLFPLAANFQESVAGNPGNECIDGNGDGTLSGLDLFLISVNFQNTVTGYNAYYAAFETGPWTGPINPAPVAYQGCGAQGQFWHLNAGLPLWYSLRPYDAGEGAEGERSAAVFVEAPAIGPPVWDTTTGVMDAWADPGQVRLFWNNATDEDYPPVKYNVYYDTESPVRIGTAAVKLSAVNAFESDTGWDWEYLVDNLQNDQPYWFTVRAEDSADPAEEEDNTVERLALPRAEPWPTDIVTFDTSFHTGLSLALDPDDLPCIAFWNEYEKLGFARYDGTNWIPQEVVHETGSGMYPSLVLFPDGTPMISYYNSNSEDLCLAFFNDTDWDLSVVDSDGSVGRYTSMALDSSNNSAISYQDWTHLNVAWYRDTDWEYWTVDSDETVGVCTNLAFAQDGYPGVSYYDETDGDLKYAKFDGSDWTIETIDDGVNAGQWNSLAMSTIGLPQISYTEGDPAQLKFARLNFGVWEYSVIDSNPAGDVGQFNSLAYPGSFTPAVTYWDSVEGALMYARDTGNGWHASIIEAGTGEAYSALVFDEGNDPHVVFSFYAPLSFLKYSKGYAF